MLTIRDRRTFTLLVFCLVKINGWAQDVNPCRCTYRDSTYYNCEGGLCNQSDSVFESNTVFVYKYEVGQISKLTILHRNSNTVKEEINFKNGKITDSITYEYREDGSTCGMHEYKDGYMYKYWSYYPSGKLRAQEYYDRQGRKTDLLVTWFESGAVEKIYYHYNGQMKLQMTLDKRGNVTTLSILENSFTPLLLMDLKKGKITGLFSMISKEHVTFGK